MTLFVSFGKFCALTIYEGLACLKDIVEKAGVNPGAYEQQKPRQ
jgi:hypothetical protein